MFIQKSTRIIYHVVNLKKLFTQENLERIGIDKIRQLEKTDLFYLVDTPHGKAKVYFMQCRPDLENCIQLNVIQEYSDADDVNSMRLFWEETLDKIRAYYNRNWIIQDGDLNLKLFK